MQLLIIADDFTGALDTGVQFSRYGIDTIMVTGSTIPTDLPDKIQVVVLDTETRKLPPEEAYRVIENIVRDCTTKEIKTIYKKVDSALRGNIGSELSALVNTADKGAVCFVPALPKMNRFTIDGIHYIDDVAVNESVFGEDPFEPVMYSSVADIIHSQSHIPVFSFSRDKLNTKSVLVKDIGSQDDLDKFADQLKKIGVPPLLAGCAGFASELPKMLGLVKSKKTLSPNAKKLFIVSGSVNPIGFCQQTNAKENGFYILQMEPEFKLGENVMETALGRGVADLLIDALEDSAKGAMVSVALGPDAVEETNRLAKEMGLNSSEIRYRISKNMGDLAAEVSKKAREVIPFVVGGDTLFSFFKALGVEMIFPEQELLPGVVLSTLPSEEHPNQVISKSGGFSEDDVYINVFKIIQNK